MRTWLITAEASGCQNRTLNAPGSAAFLFALCGIKKGAFAPGLVSRPTRPRSSAGRRYGWWTRRRRTRGPSQRRPYRLRTWRGSL